MLSYLVKPVVSYGGNGQLLFTAGVSVGALYGAGLEAGVTAD